MGDVTKLRPKLQDFIEDILYNRIEGVGVEDGDFVMTLSNGKEVIIWSDDGDLNLTIND